jgi:NAD(P)-dependent dehydrogenase (short-subunit alcohol dehydrogenase family)
MKLRNKVAIVTGAKSGIGYATAVRFVAEGAKVVLADVEDARLETAFITRSFGMASFVQVDISQEKEVSLLVEEAISQYGRVDILVNNAGIELAKRVTETNEDEWDRLISVNLKGVFLASKAVIPIMRNYGGGIIVNVASELGLVAGAEIAAYCASKGGVVQLTKAMAVDYAADHIRVNCICPGPVDTPLLDRIIRNSADPAGERQNTIEKTLMKRLGRPEEMANVILFLASEDSSYMTGSIIVVDGGLTAQ